MFTKSRLFVVAGASAIFLSSLHAAPNVTFIDTFGSTGTGNGQFATPLGIAINRTNGKIYVADASNSRIQRFNANGVYETQWGSTGSGVSQFDNPTRVAVNESTGNVYVADYNNDRVQYFNSEGAYIGQWGSAGSSNGQFNKAFSVAVNNSNGHVYVGEYTGGRIQEFTASGAFVRAWGSMGSGAGQFQTPGGIAVHPVTGQVYVCDSTNNNVQRFSATGAFEILWGSTGTGDGQFNQAGALCVDGAGRVFASDNSNNRVQIFNANGGFLTSFAMPAGLNGPVGVALDENLVLHVVLVGTNAVGRWQIQNERPVVTVNGPMRRTIHNARANFRGTATDDGIVGAVQVKVGSRAWRNARGTDSWRATINASPGRTLVQFRARDNRNRYSAVVSVRVLRR
jgi:DNA-binding beta-propeller fold protein YncE